MKAPENVFVWAEIPVLNFDRAKEFYAKILGGDLYEEKFGAHRMGFFPMADVAEGVGGAIVQGEGYTPTTLGSKVYLNGGDDLSEILNKVEIAGGNVILPKRLIREDIGYMAMFADTEGNHVCLHSKK